ncbi:MAG: Tim44/TimA family putative adaptor protein [Alphaproteobacteria bacterium]
MTAELIVYAVIAAGLVFWLRSILGTRSEDDPVRPAQRLELDSEGKVVNLDSPESDKGILINELAGNEKGNMSLADSAQDGLHDIVKIDRDFDVYAFLNAAQDAFVYIVESFAEGDRETLEDLLSPEVFGAFNGAIDAREKAGETMLSEIQSIQKSEIIESRLDNKKAYITVRFWAQETSVTKDETGGIIHGHPDKSTEMRDVWTFMRDLKTKDPRWLVVETREDGAGDNETIPNTH